MIVHTNEETNRDYFFIYIYIYGSIMNDNNDNNNKMSMKDPGSKESSGKKTLG